MPTTHHEVTKHFSLQASLSVSQALLHTCCIDRQVHQPDCVTHWLQWFASANFKWMMSCTFNKIIKKRKKKEKKMNIWEQCKLGIIIWSVANKAITSDCNFTVSPGDCNVSLNHIGYVSQADMWQTGPSATLWYTDCRDLRWAVHYWRLAFLNLNVS